MLANAKHSYPYSSIAPNGELVYVPGIMAMEMPHVQPYDSFVRQG